MIIFRPFLAVIFICSVAKGDEACQTPEGHSGICRTLDDCPAVVESSQSRMGRNSSRGRSDFDNPNCAEILGEGEAVCCPIRRAKRYAKVKLNEYCGVSANPVFKKVVNGSPAPLGAWPWMAALGYRDSDGIGWHCGGTLITHKHVITAAHCIHGRENELSVVRLGDLNLKNDAYDGAHPQDFRIRLILKHETFDPDTNEDDIGILKLSRSVRFTNYLRPICLPLSSSLRRSTYENTLPFIAGWGDTSFNGDKSYRLRHVQLPVVPNSRCQKEYEGIDNVNVNHKVICAGYEHGGKDSCQGDSGGPLMYPSLPAGQSNIYFYLIGIVSNGYKCAVPGYPGIYTRVTEYIPWIEEHVNY